MSLQLSVGQEERSWSELELGAEPELALGQQEQQRQLRRLAVEQHSSEGFLNETGFLAKQILYVVSTAHARSSDLLIEQSVSHRGHANSGCCSTVFAEEERFGTAFGACLFCLRG